MKIHALRRETSVVKTRCWHKLFLGPWLGGRCGCTALPRGAGQPQALKIIPYWVLLAVLHGDLEPNDRPIPKTKWNEWMTQAKGGQHTTAVRCWTSGLRSAMQMTPHRHHIWTLSSISPQTDFGQKQHKGSQGIVRAPPSPKAINGKVTGAKLPGAGHSDPGSMA